MDNSHYRHFTRLNNRKKTQELVDLINLYPYVDLFKKELNASIDEILIWASKNLENKFVFTGSKLIFADEKIKVNFLLRWS